MHSFKEKSWSVLLVEAHIANCEVRGTLCENCKSATQALTANFGNPNLFLYGCKDSKCKNRLLRLEFPVDASDANKDFLLNRKNSMLGLKFKSGEPPKVIEVRANS